LQEWRESAPYWEKHSNVIRTMLGPLTQALIEEAGIGPGQSVLDVAGGAGEPSLTIARVVGPAGSVMCTDAVAEMVEAAESAAQRLGIKNMRFRQCPADSLPFEDNSFDTVVSRLGAMFFPNPLVALREMLRVIRPGGTISLAVWHKSEMNPFAYCVTDVMNRYIETPPADPDAPGAFRFAEPGKLVGVLTDAGACDVRERLLKFRMEAPISAREFWIMRSETSETLRSKLTRLTADQAVRVSKEVQEAVREFFPNDKMAFPAQMIIATGTKHNDAET
ncbi:MAG: class I SAM-dependent methyltransferase, partial [Pyrinomonadaceae bacterium]